VVAALKLLERASYAASTGPCTAKTDSGNTREWAGEHLGEPSRGAVLRL